MSSIHASYSKYPQSGTRAKRRRKPKPSRPQPAFRFRDLPLEIRNEVYRVCLVDHVKTAIQPVEGYEDDYTGDDEDSDNDEFVSLVRSSHNWKTTLCLNVLLIDKATYQEAVTVLYGSNEFQFQHRYPWRDLDFFLSELSESKRGFLRRLEVNFPDIERDGLLVRSSPRTERALRIIKQLPKLTALTLRVSNDIMSSDLDHIRWINQYKGRSKVLLQVNRFPTRDEEGRKSYRLVRISAAVVGLFDDLRWQVGGDFESIDEQHPFGHEFFWLKSLFGERMWCQRCESEEEWRNELRSRISSTISQSLGLP